MGYDSENSRLVIVDIETAPHPKAADYLEPVEPARNLKDPEKIAADVAKRERDRSELLALDWNVNRIVAIGCAEGHLDPIVILVHDEQQERIALERMWTLVTARNMVGFCARTFDVPTLIQRSRLLGVSHPRLSLARYGRGDVIDLYDLLTFDDQQRSYAMRRSLRAFAKRFDIPCDDTIDGRDIPGLVADAHWDAIVDHVRSDVVVTRLLAQRIGVWF